MLELVTLALLLGSCVPSPPVLAGPPHDSHVTPNVSVPSVSQPVLLITPPLMSTERNALVNGVVKLPVDANAGLTDTTIARLNRRFLLLGFIGFSFPEIYRQSICNRPSKQCLRQKGRAGNPLLAAGGASVPASRASEEF